MTSATRTTMIRLTVIPPRPVKASGFSLGGRIVGAALLHLGNHQDLGLLQAPLRAIAVAITVTVAITAVSARALLGFRQRRPDNTRPRGLKPIHRLDRSPSAGLAALDDEQGASSGSSKQGSVGKAECRRTVDQNPVERLLVFGDDLSVARDREGIGKIRRQGTTRQEPQILLLRLDDMSGERVLGGEQLAHPRSVALGFECRLAKIAVDRQDPPL